MSYDGSGYGNITGKTDVGTYDYTGGVHKVTSVTNPTVLMQNRPKQHIEYTKFNKVGYIRDSLNTGAERELFITYGPDQQRVKTLYKEDGIDVKTKYFALGQYEKETDSTGNVRELYYISGADGVVAVLQRMNEQDSIFYIHKDYLGSYDVISNQNGTVKERYNFDPWGRRRNSADWSYDNVSSSFFIDRGFTGHEHLDQFNLINMNGRVYDPLMAMFLSPDNFVQSPDLTQNFNRYTYCLNNPLKYSDPSGYSYKAYMDYIYDEGNYWYRGQAPGTWTDWESFHHIGSGGAGSYGTGIISATDINSLWKSTYGGSWSNFSGINYFNSDVEGFLAGCLYNEINDSWGYTVGGSFSASVVNYDRIISQNNLTASTNGLGMSPESQSLQALRQYIAIVAGESGNNLQEAQAIGSVIKNRLNVNNASILEIDFISKIGGAGQYDAIGGDIYNSIMNSSWQDILSENSLYSTRVSGAVTALLSDKDYSGGAYFWNASTPQIGFNWNCYKNGTFTITNTFGGTTFFRYTDTNKRWP